MHTGRMQGRMVDAPPTEWGPKRLRTFMSHGRDWEAVLNFYDACVRGTASISQLTQEAGASLAVPHDQMAVLPCDLAVLLDVAAHVGQVDSCVTGIEHLGLESRLGPAPAGTTSAGAAPTDAHNDVQLTLSYFGPAFCGWASQPGQATVEGALSAALSPLLTAANSQIVDGQGGSGQGGNSQIVDGQGGSGQGGDGQSGSGQGQSDEGQRGSGQGQSGNGQSGDGQGHSGEEQRGSGQGQSGNGQSGDGQGHSGEEQRGSGQGQSGNGQSSSFQGQGGNGQSGSFQGQGGNGQSGSGQGRKKSGKTKSTITITVSGRTDKGVHATGQVASFYSWAPVNVDQLQTSLSSHLPHPGSLRIVGVDMVPRRDTPKGKDTICTLTQARATEVVLPASKPDSTGSHPGVRALCIELVGDRFLRRMVRVLVATAVREAVYSPPGVSDAPLHVPLTGHVKDGEREGQEWGRGVSVTQPSHAQSTQLSPREDMKRDGDDTSSTSHAADGMKGEGEGGSVAVVSVPPASHAGRGAAGWQSEGNPPGTRAAGGQSPAGNVDLSGPALQLRALRGSTFRFAKCLVRKCQQNVRKCSTSGPSCPTAKIEVATVALVASETARCFSEVLETCRPLSYHEDCFVALARVKGGRVGEQVVFKSFLKERISPVVRAQVDNEALIHASLSHLSVLPLHLVLEDYDKIYLVLAYAEAGDLRQHMSRPMSELRVREFIVLPLLHGLEYLEQENIVHRDLKPENVVISEGNLLLADFGLAVVEALSLQETDSTFDDPNSCSSSSTDILAPSHCTRTTSTSAPHPKLGPCMSPCGSNASSMMASSVAGTPLYAAPEILSAMFKGKAPHEAVSHKNDMWALGIIILEALTGSHPFSDHYDHGGIIHSIVNMSKINLPASLSPDVANFIEQLLHKDPEQRARASKLLDHPWLSRVYAGDDSNPADVSHNGGLVDFGSVDCWEY
eukprot:gene6173-2788_t